MEAPEEPRRRPAPGSGEEGREGGIADGLPRESFGRTSRDLGHVVALLRACVLNEAGPRGSWTEEKPNRGRSNAKTMAETPTPTIHTNRN